MKPSRVVGWGIATILGTVSLASHAEFSSQPEPEPAWVASVTASMASQPASLARESIAALPAARLGDSAELGLWHFVTNVQALQQGRSFELLESRLQILELASSDAVSTVPLPGAAWLLVMGVLGLTGVKVTSRSKAAERLPEPAWPALAS